MVFASAINRLTRRPTIHTLPVLPIRTRPHSASLIPLIGMNWSPKTPCPMLRWTVSRSIRPNCLLTAVAPSISTAIISNSAKGIMPNCHPHVIGTSGPLISTLTISNRHLVCITTPRSVRGASPLARSMTASVEAQLGRCHRDIPPKTPSMFPCLPCRGDFEVVLPTCSSCGACTGSRPQTSPSL